MAQLSKTNNINAQHQYDQHVASLVSRIQNIRWFTTSAQQDSTVEENLKEFGDRLELSGYSVRWLSLNELSDLISAINLAENPQWSKLSPIPELIRQTAETAGRTEQLAFVFDELPEKVFHAAYDGAFRAFETYGELTLKHAVGTALYVSGLAVGWEMFAEAGQLAANPFIPLIQVFESGHWPIGLYNLEFFVL